jgi:hypothetical protein
VTGLPPREKDELLLRVVTGDPHVAAELRQRCRPRPGAAGSRTVGELLAAAATRRTARLAEQARLVDAERAGRKVHAFIGTKRPSDYDDAVTLLVDLEAVSDSSTFIERVQRLRDDHRRKPSLMQRLDRAGL